jgi:hypothetical protein
MFVIIHMTLILVLLALSSIRKAFLAMIMNVFIEISLTTGFFAYARLDLILIKRFIIFLSALLIISIITMFVEAFVLTDKSHRYEIFLLNAPILIDIGFVILHSFYLK